MNYRLSQQYLSSNAERPSVPIAPVRSEVQIRRSQRLFTGLVIYYWCYYLVVDTFERGFNNQAVGTDVVVGGTKYLALVLPLVAWTVWEHQAIFRARERALTTLFFFLVPATIVSLGRGDIASLTTLGQLLLPLIIVLNRSLEVSTKLLNRLFLIAVAVSVATTIMGLNPYGFLPGQSTQLGQGLWWRTSLFAYQSPPVGAAVALLVLVANLLLNPPALLRQRERQVRLASMAFAFYFLALSASRTALLAALAAFAFTALFRLQRVPKRSTMTVSLAFMPLFVLAVAALVTLQPAVLLGLVEDSASLQRVVFHNVGDLDAQTVRYEGARAEIWAANFSLFRQNPIIGLGTFNFSDYFPGNLGGASEAPSIILLARFGISALFLPAFLYRWYLNSVRSRAEASAALVLVLVIYWLFFGSFVVGYNPVYLILLGLVNTDKRLAAPRVTANQ